LFARVDNLNQALKRSGLWQLGINSPDIFWQEVVYPTWREGSTTARGYQAVIAERIDQRAQAAGDEIAMRRIAQAAASFVEHYFQASPLDPGWKPLIVQALALPDTVVVAATDHYAEATAHIAAQLDHLGFGSVSAAQSGVSSGAGRNVIIANSADLGCRKASLAFWERLQTILALHSPARIVLIDDFGFNEQESEGYAEQGRVQARMNKTIEALSSVFQLQPHIFPFFIEHGSADPYTSYQKLVIQASEFAFNSLGG
jgi:hypothetical protein